MKTTLIFILLFIVISFSNTNAEIAPGRGILFFDRGHYWIELTFHKPDGKVYTPENPDPSHFTILNLSNKEMTGFSPSRVKVDYAKNVVILSSGKLKGKMCYRVTYRVDESDHIVFDLICDPFYFKPSDKECGAKSFFAHHIAPAFSRSGNLYNLNRFSYGYELSENKEISGIDIQPRFKLRGWEFIPALQWDRVTYRSSGKATSTGRRTFDMELSHSVWIKELRYSLFMSYNHKRFTTAETTSEIPTFSQSISVEGIVRLDYFFDNINKFCYSVFKGVDLGFGYSWYNSNDKEVCGKSDFSATPFLKTRFTWTLFYGLQFSYSLESSFPSSVNDIFEEFHQIRLRLLLRELLPTQRQKSYHPDLEFVFDTGKRPPFFIEERKVSLGFTFDLFPW